MCLETGLNCRHKDFQSFALPTELSKRLRKSFIKISPCISNNFKDVCNVLFDKPFLFLKNFNLNLSKSVLFDKTCLNNLSSNQNLVSILISENSLVLVIFQVVKNLVI